MGLELPRNPTRPVQIGSITIGGGQPIAVQSMCATKTADVEATAAQCNDLAEAGAGIVRIAVDSRERRPGPGRNPPADDRQSVGRSARELPPGGRGGPARRQDPLQPGPSLPPRAEAPLAGQGPMAGRRGRRARLRDPHGGQLRLGRSGPAGQASGGRLDRPHAAKCAGTLELLDSAGVYAVLRVAEGFRSGQGDRGQSPLRRSSGPTCRCTWA